MGLYRAKTDKKLLGDFLGSEFFNDQLKDLHFSFGHGIYSGLFWP